MAEVAFNNIPEIISNIKFLSDKKIHVGVVGDGQEELATYAGANEFGTKRAGKNRKTVIPERSYLRSTFDDDKKMTDALKPIDNVFEDKFNKKRALNIVGAKIVGHVQEKISSNIPPRNAQSTINKKKSSKTLIDQGTLREAQDFDII